MTLIQPPRLEILPHPFFIVTEGMGDARFIDELLQFKGITNCSVGCPSRESSRNRVGKDAFPEYLLAIQTARVRANSTPLRGLLVVADSDTNEDTSFNAIAAALENAQFPKPNRPFEISDASGFKVAIYLIPGEGETGTLEHLLLRAVFKQTPALEKCLADLATCTGGLRSSKANALAKMKMSALAAAFCESNPWCSPANMWSDKGNPVPITSDCFAHIQQFLTAFAA